MASTLTREQNRLRMQQYRAKKKAKAATDNQQPPSDTGAVLTGGEDTAPLPELEITVKTDEAPKPKMSLRERLGFGAPKQATPTPAKRGTSRGRVDAPNLVVTVLPTLLASFIAAWARDRVPDEYQPCAPSQAEVKAIIGPLLDILGDEVAIAARVSKNTLRIINSLICTMAYGARAYVTYVDIKKAKEKDEKAASYSQPASGGPGAYQAPAHRTGPAFTGGDGRGRGESNAGITGYGADADNDDIQLRDIEASIVADMFKRDKQGRQFLGLLPRAV